MFLGDAYAGGFKLNFLESADFEAVDNLDDSQRSEALVRNVLRILMMGWSDHWQELLTRQTVKAVFIQRDKKLTKVMREEFQQGLHHVYSQLQDKTLSPLEHKQAELFISNCIMYLPFFDITPHESLAIPQWIENQWQLVDYKVVPIELTPTSGFQKLFIEDEDRVFAYGLEPVTQDKAESHLIFMGTTYPEGQGFHTQVNTDLGAFATAGSKLYQSGRPRILQWINTQTHPIHVCGTSLGGSLSLLLACDQGDKLSRVDALNPAGIFPYFNNSLSDWDALSSKPIVTIQRQGSEPVSRFGLWSNDWNLIQITPPADKKGPNGLTDHALNYAGLEGTQFIHLDPIADNAANRHRNFWLYGVLRALVYYVALAPYHYVILPATRFLWRHKLQIFITLVLSAIVLWVSPFVLGAALPLAATVAFITFGAMAAVINGYLVSQFILCDRDNDTGARKSDIFKFIEWLNIKTKHAFSTDSIVLAVSLMLFGSVMLAPVLPIPVLPIIVASIILAIASLPLLAKGIMTLYSIVNTITGKNIVLPLESHEPDLINACKKSRLISREVKEYKNDPCLLNDETLSKPAANQDNKDSTDVSDLKKTVKALNRLGVNAIKKTNTPDSDSIDQLQGTVSPMV